MSIWSAIFFIGSAQGLLLAAALLLRRDKSRADALLGAWLALFSADLALLLFVTEGWYRSFPHMLHLSVPFTFLYGPAFWLYVRFMTGDKKAWRLRDFLHLIPFAAACAGFLPFYLMDAASKVASMESAATAAPSLLGVGLAAIRILHGSVYLILGVVAVTRRQGSGGGDKVDGKDPSGRWLAWLSATQVAIWGIAALALGLLFLDARVGRMAERLIWPVGALSVQSMGAWALMNGGLFPNRPWGKGADGGKYRKTRVEAGLAESYRDRLALIMEEERPWLDPGLKLEDLAALVGCRPYALSQVVNQVFGMRFTDLVNARRVREAASLLSDRAHSSRSVLDIAFSCGFNSKAVFNAAFKRFTGATPSEYRLKRGMDS